MEFARRARQLVAYKPIEPIKQVAERLGLSAERIIKLDANENLHGLPPDVQGDLLNGVDFSIYPDPQQRIVRSAIARYTGFSAEQIVAGAGSDELIDLVFRLFLNPGDGVLIFPPTFPFYDHLATLNDCPLFKVQRNKDFLIDLADIKTVPWASIGLIVVASPNNPTGNCVDAEILRTLLDKGIPLLLDEAYFEFSQTSYVDWVQEYPHLIVLRTFSKAFAMAGMRLGYAVGAAGVIEKLHQIKPPYSVNVVAEKAFCVWMDHLDLFQQTLAQIEQTKLFTWQELQKIPGLKVYPSAANFFWVKILSGICHFSTGAELKNELLQQGILIRCYGAKELVRFFRVSIGRMEQMEFFCRVLHQICSKKPL